MATISSVSSTLLQSAVSQTSSSTTVNASTTSYSPSSTVSLKGATPAPLTYNASGQLGSSQISQLEQAINTDISNTIAGLFSGTSNAVDTVLNNPPVVGSTSVQSSSSSATTPDAQAAQGLLDAQNVINSTLSSLSSSSGDGSSSSF
jgi:hypothetical protein